MKLTQTVSGSGTLVLTGLESQVEALKANATFCKKLTEDVEQQKLDVRLVVADALRSIDPVVLACAKRVDVPGETKGGVSVTLPDPALKGNRTILKEEYVERAKAAGFGVMLEEEESAALSGEWVKWLKDAMSAWKKAGMTLPDGVEIVTKTRLKAEAVESLREYSKLTGMQGEVAGQLLDVGLKQFSVSVK